MSSECPDALLPDGDVCPRCGNPRAPSGVDGGSWLHFPRTPEAIAEEWARRELTRRREYEKSPEFLRTALATSEARVVDLTARVAVLEEKILAMLDYHQQQAQTQWKDWAPSQVNAMITVMKLEARDIFASSSPTLGSAWRAMVEALHEIDQGVDHAYQGGGPDMREFQALARAALAAAKAVMGT